MSGPRPAPCEPEECAGHPGPRAGLPTAIARLALGIPFVLAGALCSPPVVLLSASLRDRVTSRWSRSVLRVFGLRIRVTGTPVPRQPGGVMVVANHISWLDVPLLATVLPGRNLAKSEIRRWPVLGWIAAVGGTLFVEREGPRSLPATVRIMASALGAGSRVVVFPEGTTRCGREQGPFAPAVFQAALDANSAVQPVHVAYRTRDGRFTGAPAFVGDDTLPRSLWRVAKAGGLTAHLTLLPPIPAGRHTGRGSLALAARTAVVRAQPAPSENSPSTGAARRAIPFTRSSRRQTAVASESANLPPSSVHQCVNSIPEEASSLRTPS